MSSPESRSMRGWGRWLGDLEQPQTLQEAQLHATMACADRLVELVTLIQDIQTRLARIEIWIERNDPNYLIPAPDYERVALPIGGSSNGAAEAVQHNDLPGADAGPTDATTGE